MKGTGLTQSQLDLIRDALCAHAGVTGALLFGSRATGRASPWSDIDLALEGIDDEVRAEAIARALDDLPMPYRFDVKALAAISYIPLREHILRVGVRIFP